MLTTIILCIAIAFIFYKIGIYAVLLMALSIALKVALALILALSGVLTWRWWRSRKIYTPWRKL